MTRESEFLQAIASRDVVRLRAAAIVVLRDHTLVQGPTDDPGACCAFIGSEYEFGDTLADPIRREFEDETNTARHVVVPLRGT